METNVPASNAVLNQVPDSTETDMELSWSSTSCSPTPSKSNAKGFERVPGKYGDHSETEVLDSSNDELLTPVSKFCNFAHFVVDHHHNPASSPEENIEPRFYDRLQRFSPTSSIVYESSICSDHTYRFAALGDEDLIPLSFGRRTKKAPKHRSELYSFIPSKICSNSNADGQRVEGKRLITAQCNAEKQESAQRSFHNLVVDVCKDVMGVNPALKFKSSSIATLFRTVDEYRKGIVDDFQLESGYGT